MQAGWLYAARLSIPMDRDPHKREEEKVVGFHLLATPNKIAPKTASGKLPLLLPPGINGDESCARHG